MSCAVLILDRRQLNARRRQPPPRTGIPLLLLLTFFLSLVVAWMPLSLHDALHQNLLFASAQTLSSAPRIFATTLSSVSWNSSDDVQLNKPASQAIYFNPSWPSMNSFSLTAASSATDISLFGLNARIFTLGYTTTDLMLCSAAGPIVVTVSRAVAEIELFWLPSDIAYYCTDVVLLIEHTSIGEFRLDSRVFRECTNVTMLLYNVTIQTLNVAYSFATEANRVTLGFSNSTVRGVVTQPSVAACAALSLPNVALVFVNMTWNQTAFNVFNTSDDNSNFCERLRCLHTAEIDAPTNSTSMASFPLMARPTPPPQPNISELSSALNQTISYCGDGWRDGASETYTAAVIDAVESATASFSLIDALPHVVASSSSLGGGESGANLSTAVVDIWRERFYIAGNASSVCQAFVVLLGTMSADVMLLATLPYAVTLRSQYWMGDTFFPRSAGPFNNDGSLATASTLHVAANTSAWLHAGAIYRADGTSVSLPEVDPATGAYVALELQSLFGARLTSISIFGQTSVAQPAFTNRTVGFAFFTATTVLISSLFQGANAVNTTYVLSDCYIGDVQIEYSLCAHNVGNVSLVIRGCRIESLRVAAMGYNADAYVVGAPHPIWLAFSLVDCFIASFVMFDSLGALSTDAPIAIGVFGGYVHEFRPPVQNAYSGHHAMLVVDSVAMPIIEWQKFNLSLVPPTVLGETSLCTRMPAGTIDGSAATAAPYQCAEIDSLYGRFAMSSSSLAQTWAVGNCTVRLEVKAWAGLDPATSILWQPSASSPPVPFALSFPNVSTASLCFGGHNFDLITLTNYVHVDNIQIALEQFSATTFLLSSFCSGSNNITVWIRNATLRHVTTPQGGFDVVYYCSGLHFIFIDCTIGSVDFNGAIARRSWDVALWFHNCTFEGNITNYGFVNAESTEPLIIGFVNSRLQFATSQSAIGGAGLYVILQNVTTATENSLASLILSNSTQGGVLGNLAQSQTCVMAPNASALWSHGGDIAVNSTCERLFAQMQSIVDWTSLFAPSPQQCAMTPQIRTAAMYQRDSAEIFPFSRVSQISASATTTTIAPRSPDVATTTATRAVIVTETTSIPTAVSTMTDVSTPSSLSETSTPTTLMPLTFAPSGFTSLNTDNATRSVVLSTALGVATSPVPSAANVTTKAPTVTNGTALSTTKILAQLLGDRPTAVAIVSANAIATAVTGMVSNPAASKSTTITRLVSMVSCPFDQSWSADEPADATQYVWIWPVDIDSQGSPSLDVFWRANGAMISTLSTVVGAWLLTVAFWFVMTNPQQQPLANHHVAASVTADSSISGRRDGDEDNGDSASRPASPSSHRAPSDGTMDGTEAVDEGRAAFSRLATLLRTIAAAASTYYLPNLASVAATVVFWSSDSAEVALAATSVALICIMFALSFVALWKHVDAHMTAESAKHRAVNRRSGIFFIVDYIDGLDLAPGPVTRRSTNGAKSLVQPSTSAAIVERYAVVRFTLWFDLLTATLVGFVQGIHPERGCAALSGVVLAVVCLNAIYVVIVRPYIRVAELTLIIAVNAITVALAIAALVAQQQALAGGGIAAVSGSMLTVLGALTMVASVTFYLQCVVLIALDGWEAVQSSIEARAEDQVNEEMAVLHKQDSQRGTFRDVLRGNTRRPGSSNSHDDGFQSGGGSGTFELEGASFTTMGVRRERERSDVAAVTRLVVPLIESVPRSRPTRPAPVNPLSVDRPTL